MSAPARGALVISSALLLVLAGCKKAPEPDCQPVGTELLGQIQRATASRITVAFAVPSRTVGNMWLVGAQTSRGVAVWTSSIPPDGSGLSFVLNANQAAVEDSVVGVDVPEGTGEPAADALKDTAGIAAAAACVTSATPG